MTAERWLSPTQVAPRIGCTPRHVVNLARAGLLGAIDARCPGARRARWRIPLRGLEEFLAEREIFGINGNRIAERPVSVRASVEDLEE